MSKLQDMGNENHVNGNRALQAVRDEFQTVRVQLPKSWLSDILRQHPELDSKQQIERLKNIRLGRTTPTPDEIKLFEAVLSLKPSQSNANQ